MSDHLNYDYIKRVYGASFYEGDEVQLEDGTSAMVLPPKPSQLHYVHVKLESGIAGVCHPRSLKIIARGPEWSAAQEWTND